VHRGGENICLVIRRDQCRRGKDAWKERGGGVAHTSATTALGILEIYRGKKRGKKTFEPSETFGERVNFFRRESNVYSGKEGEGGGEGKALIKSEQYGINCKKLVLLTKGEIAWAGYCTGET